MCKPLRRLIEMLGVSVKVFRSEVNFLNSHGRLFC